jgi:glycerol-3-phosphate dehydrogenase (NAD(P)+)
MSETFRTVGVIGAGAWGTALALVCARAGLDVTVYARETEVADDINTLHENRTFLPGAALDPAIRAVSSPEALAGRDLYLNVTPAQHLRSSLRAFAPVLAPGAPMVLCAKGIEQGSLKLMTEVLSETLPDARPAVLSGPSFAAEVARGLPTAVTLACPDEALGAALARAVAGPAFRPYAVLAIACGVSEGRGLGRSAHAALITRGFAELTRMAVALGGRAETVAGLCGLGDLVLTCSSPQSRNMSVGLALGQGQSLADALAGKVSVAEGVASAPAVRELAARIGVEAPICEAVAAILAGEVGVEAAITGLLSRPLKSER